MTTSGFKNFNTSVVVFLALIWFHLTVEGSDVRFASPGQSVSLPCSYSYEDHGALPELSVQWKSPQRQLLCHFVKHKSFRNCSSGYQLQYSPGSINLTVDRVQEQDYGFHLCTVGKRHEFTDTQVELSRRTQTDPVTPVPGRGAAPTAPCWTLLLCTFWLAR